MLRDIEYDRSQEIGSLISTNRTLLRLCREVWYPFDLILILVMLMQHM